MKPPRVSHIPPLPGGKASASITRRRGGNTETYTHLRIHTRSFGGRQKKSLCLCVGWPPVHVWQTRALLAATYARVNGTKGFGADRAGALPDPVAPPRFTSARHVATSWLGLLLSLPCSVRPSLCLPPSTDQSASRDAPSSN